MLHVTIIALAILLLGGAQAEEQMLNSHDQDNQSCNQSFVTHTEFEAHIELQQREIDSLQGELKCWQNTSLEILKKYVVDNNGGGSKQCFSEDLKDGIEELSEQMRELLNQTRGTDTTLTSMKVKIEQNGNGDNFIKDQLEEIEQKIQRLYHQIQDLDIKLSSQSIQLENIEVDVQQCHIMEQNISLPLLGSFCNPVSSCKFIPQGSSSGHYWIQYAEAAYANLEYCDMTRRCCNSTGGWMRVANINMTDTNQNCPSGFRLITSPKRTCGTPGSSCVSTTFPVNGVKYSRVCGKIIGYQIGSTDAFNPYYFNRRLTIDNLYIEGVSLTHGQTPRKHIWTFAAALDELRSNDNSCPCTKTDATYIGRVPPYIGQDYFCDTGSRNLFQLSRFYSADPLWDGSGCGPTSSCCGFNNPPWFCKQLQQTITDDIEMRVCVNQATSNEDVALETVEIYVQ